MGYYTRSIEQLNAEYNDRTSITLFGRQATMLRLLADSYEVRLRFERLYDMMKEGPVLIEDAEFDYMAWADESRWTKPEATKEVTATQTASTLGIKEFTSQSYANRMKDALGGRLDKIDVERYSLIMSSVITTPEVISDFEFDLAIDENIKQIRQTLTDIHQFKNTHTWKNGDYARAYYNFHDTYEKGAWKDMEVKKAHYQWLKDIVADPDLNDYCQRRRELLLDVFKSGFFDAIRRTIHTNAADDLKFCDIDDAEMMPDLNDTLKWYAGFKRLCPMDNNKMFSFNEHARLGKYIYDHNIPKDVCWRFFHFVSLMEIVQEQMDWLLHPENKPNDDNETVSRFVDKAVQIMLKAADKNGETIKYKDNRQNELSYQFEVNGKAFKEVMERIQADYPELIIGYLDGSTGDNAVGLTKVCPFIGRVVSLHLFNKADVRNVDFEQAFQFVYGETNKKGGKPSYIQKMSATQDIKDKPVFDTIKTLFEEQKKTQLLEGK